MEMLIEGRAHLSQKVPGLQLAWDATSLSDFKACPRRYYFNQLCGWRSKAESPHLTFGIYFHRVGEYYDHARAKGADHEEACEVSIRRILQETEGWESEDNYKNRSTLLRSAVWYLEEYKQDTIQTYILPNGKPAVELSFRMETPYASRLTGETFTLAGHLDKVGTQHGGLYILDKKTTKSALGPFYFDSYNPHNQMSLYTIAGGVVLDAPVAGVIIDAAQIGVTFTRFARGYVTRTKAQLVEYLDSLRIWLGFAEKCAEEGNWPQNEASCGLYGGCPFRGICSKDPGVRKAFLSVDYHQLPWNPLESRGSEE